MPKRDKDACNILVVNAIKQVVPGFRHTCDVSSKSVSVLGSRVDEYCTVKNGRRTRTTLNPHQYYPICYRMRTKVIDLVLPPAHPDPPGDAATAANINNGDPPPGGGVTAGNNNTNTADPPVVGATIRDPPGGVVGGIMLPRTANIKQASPECELFFLRYGTVCMCSDPLVQ